MGVKTCKRYSPCEDTYLRIHFHHQTGAEMARHLNRSQGSVSGRCKLIGLKLSDAERKARLEIGLKKGWALEETRFKKGQQSWNKGTKGVCKANAGSFKKGNKPHNAKPVGTIVIDGYAKLKIAEPGVWMSLHQHIYQQHHGPIPANSFVHFKDGNRSNFDINNLELFDRVQNMKQNSIHNYPLDLKQAIWALTSLNRKIKKHE